MPRTSQYTFNFTTLNDGAKSVSLDLSGDTYPNVPRVTNYAALQVANSSAAITVQWAAMTGGSTQDFIMLSVYDNQTGGPVFQTDGPGSPTALNGTSLQATIPLGTLVAGRSYEAEVMFVKVTDLVTTYAVAVAGYSKMVSFNLKTTAAAGVALGSQFVSALPAAGAVVARDSAISFRFSQPLTPGFKAMAWTIDGAAVAASNFTYQWIDNNQVLLCRYNSTLPASAEIGWSLTQAGFKDAAGFFLGAGTVAGTFRTTAEDPAGRPDVAGIYLMKMRGFKQTGATPVSSGMFGCDTTVEMPAFNRVEHGTLTIAATGGSGSLWPSAWDPALGIEATYASKTDLDRFFANGDFTVDLTTLADGAKTVTLSLGADDDYPAAPGVTNLTELQAIDASAPVTITWNALAGWNSTPTAGSGMIELQLDNDQGNGVLWLDGSDISSNAQCTLPAGALWPGRSYRVNLVFTKIKDLDTTSYAGAMAGAGFASVTEFTIRTAGSPVMPTVALSRAGNGINLGLLGSEPQRNYVIEASRDMRRWLPIQQVWLNGPQNPNQYYDNDAQYLGSRYYRLRDCAPAESVQPNVTIQGTVWADGSHTTPVAGAVVGTTLDGQTAVTDRAGRFFLESDTAGGYGSNFYTITVTSGATTRDFGPYSGDQPRQQQYNMN